MTPSATPLRRLIVGISGASGVIYGVRALEVLKAIPDIETHLVLSAAAKRTLVEETDQVCPVGLNGGGKHAGYIGICSVEKRLKDFHS